ncbi:MAG: lamin tail domain-containing protein, partial [Limisphaerales bacterium]
MMGQTPQSRLLVGLLGLGVLTGVWAPTVHADWIAQGVFRYTDRTYDDFGFTGTIVRPVREADVEVYDKNSQAVLGTTVTDATGAFNFIVVDGATRDIAVRVVADTTQTASLNFSVVDDANSDAVYSYNNPATDRNGHSEIQSVDFGTITMPLATGPIGSTDWSSQIFNTFDCCLLLADWIQSVDGTRPTVAFSVGWNPNNGRGGSFYNGGANRFSLSDDDAYDDPNILHELGHYVEDEYGLSHNIGGQHAIGDDDEDPRLAFSEGFATYVSNATLIDAGRPRPDLYSDRDSFDTGSGGGFGYSLENNVIGGASNEQAVNAAMYDLLDNAATQDASFGVDDDGMGAQGGNVWAVIEQMRINNLTATSFEDFWDIWRALALGNESGVQIVFALHGIDFQVDAQEPNDRPMSATSLTVGGAYQENTFYSTNTNPEGDEDWFQFTAVVGNHYRVEVNGAANSILGRPDPEMFVTDVNLSRIIGYNDDPVDYILNTQTNSTAQDMLETVPTVLFCATNSGVHHVFVRHSSKPRNLGGRYGTYQIRVQQVAAPTPTIGSVASQLIGNGTVYPILIKGTNFSTDAMFFCHPTAGVLTNIVWLGPDAVSAVLQRSLMPTNGTYGITVTNKGGGNSHFTNAFTINTNTVPEQHVAISEVELGADKVEIYNYGTNPVNLTSWQIVGRVEGVTQTYTFANFTLTNGQRVVVSEDPGTDTATNLFDRNTSFNWPWVNSDSGDVALLDNSGRNIDFIRFVGSPTTTHQDPPGTGGNWTQPEVQSPPLGFTLARADDVPLLQSENRYRTRSGLSAALPTMPDTFAGRENATDFLEPNDAPNQGRLIMPGEFIHGLFISDRPGGEPADVDWHNVVVRAGDDFHVRVRSSAPFMGDLDFDIYRPGNTTTPILVGNSPSTSLESAEIPGSVTAIHGSGIYRVRVRAGTSATGRYVLETAGPEPPMLMSSIPPQFVSPLGMLSVPFVIGDSQTPAANLVVTAFSSDQAIFPDGNLVTGGSGSNRTVTLMPLATSGAATISIVISEGTNSTTNVFRAAVAQTPGSATSFDNGLVSWLHDPFDHGDWLLTNGPTETPNTGPFGAFFGTNYIYTEATPGGNHLGSPNRTAHLLAGLDLAGVTNPAMTFAYHMFGTNMGSLSIDVFDSVWISNVWTRSGTQQFSMFDPWRHGVVDLNPFANKSNLQIRVRGVTGTNHLSDIGFDRPVFATNAAPEITNQLFITAELPPMGTPVGTVNAFDPGAGPLTNFLFDILTTNSPFAIDATNGLVTVTNPVALDLGITNQLFFDVRVTDVLGLTNSATITVNLIPPNGPPALLSMLGTVFIKPFGVRNIPFTIGDPETAASNLVVTASSSDQAVIPDANLLIAGPDSNRVLTIVPLTPSGSATISLTISDGTNSVTNVFKAGLEHPVGVGTNFDSGLFSWVQELTDDGDWTLQNGPTPTIGSGPAGALSGTNYLFTEADAGQSPGNPNRTALLTAGLDFTGVTNPALSFAYHMFGSDMGSLSVDVFDTVWISNVWTRTGQQHTSTVEPWTDTVVDLQPFSNKTNIQVRFRGTTGTNLNSDMAIDIPFFQNNTPPMITNQTFVTEDMPLTNAVVGTVIAIDIGTGPATNMIFVITNAMSPFQIHPTSGLVTVTNPAALDASGTNPMLFDVRVTDALGLTNQATITVNLVPRNDHPILLSSIGDTFVNFWETSPLLPFNIGDRETAAGSLTVSGFSSDTNIFRNDRIVFSGSGSNRFVQLLQPAFLRGNAIISLIVSDGTNSVTNAFRAAVETPLSSITSLESGLESWLQDLNDDGDWTLTNAPTFTPNTGPSNSFFGTNYIYTESSTGSNPGNTNRTASIYTQVDLTHTNPVFSFAYHMFGTNMGNLSVDVFDGAWFSNVWIRSGQQHFST